METCSSTAQLFVVRLMELRPLANKRKGHELKARQEFIDNSLESAFCDIYLGFLSNDEIREIIDGKDIWMGKDEILKRFKSNKET